MELQRDAKYRLTQPLRASQPGPPRTDFVGPHMLEQPLTDDNIATYRFPAPDKYQW